jgi:hypothetical protein
MSSIKLQYTNLTYKNQLLYSQIIKLLRKKSRKHSQSQLLQKYLRIHFMPNLDLKKRKKEDMNINGDYMGRNQWEAGEGKKSAQKHIIKVHYMHV